MTEYKPVTPQQQPKFAGIKTYGWSLRDSRRNGRRPLHWSDFAPIRESPRAVPNHWWGL